jgi:hypothetical protein
MRLPTRLNILLKLGSFTFFAMISKTQSLEGVCSRVSEDKHGGKHIILLDLEGASLEQVVEALRKIQLAYGLGDFWVTSDCEGSYRAWCFSVRPWTTYLRIMLDLIDYGVLDYNFYFWSVKRAEATLRTSNKHGRPPQQVVAYLQGFELTEIPAKLKRVIYDTGVEKKGLVFRFPFKRA